MATADSRPRTISMAANTGVCQSALRRSMSRNSARTTTAPHTTGGASRNPSREKATIPARLPRMSRRYASRGGNCRKVRATPSPTRVITPATPRNRRGRVTNGGSPLRVPRAPKKMSSVPERSISTGNSRTNPTRTARAMGAKRNRSRPALALRNPRPMPRKLASRMKLEK